MFNCTIIEHKEEDTLLWYTRNTHRNIAIYCTMDNKGEDRVVLYNRKQKGDIAFYCTIEHRKIAFVVQEKTKVDIGVHYTKDNKRGIESFIVQSKAKGNNVCLLYTRKKGGYLF